MTNVLLLLRAISRTFPSDRIDILCGSGSELRSLASLDNVEVLPFRRSGLKELDRLKTKFVSDVSHELRTPVTNLSLYLGLLERGRAEKQAEYLGVLREQVDRLGRLIEDILGWSRLVQEKEHFSPEPVDLNAVIRPLVDSQQAGGDHPAVDGCAVPERGRRDRRQVEQPLDAGRHAVAGAIPHIS